MAASLGKMPTTSVFGAALDLAVEPLQWMRAAQLGAMLRGECHLGEHLGFGVVHHGGEFEDGRRELVGNLAPLLVGGSGVILGEGGCDEGRDDLPAAAAGMGERVPHEANVAALLVCGQHIGDGRRRR